MEKETKEIIEMNLEEERVDEAWRNYRESTQKPKLALSDLDPKIIELITQKVLEKIEAKKLATAGALLQGFFIIILATINPSMSLITIVILVALSAGSLAIFTNSNGTSVMNATPKASMSTISGMLNLSRTFGFSLATGLSSAFFALFLAIYNPTGAVSGLEFEMAYYQSLGITFLILALFAFLGVVISLMRGRRITKEL